MSIKQSNNNSNQTSKGLVAENNSAYNVEEEEVLVATHKSTFSNNRVVDASVKGNNDKISNNLITSSNCNSSSSIPSRPMSSDSNNNNSLSYDARNPCSDRLPSSNSGDNQMGGILNNPYFFLKKNRSITIGAAA